jgi:putative SOS response-associated peptidase YedK
MCGRFSQRTPAERLRREFGLREVPGAGARFNVAPSQNVLAVRQAEGGREAVWLKWGLVPSWAKDASMGAPH